MVMKKKALKKPTIDKTYVVVSDLVIAPSQTAGGGGSMEILHGTKVVSLKGITGPLADGRQWFAKAGETLYPDPSEWFCPNAGQRETCLAEEKGENTSRKLATEAPPTEEE